MSRADRIIGSLCLSGAAAIWGGTYVVSSAVLSVIPPWTLLEMRFVLSLLVLGVVAAVRRAWRVGRSDVWLLAVIGLVGYAVSIGMQFIGTKLSGAAMGSLVTAASPALIALFAFWILGERLSRMHWIAFGLGLSGIVAAIGLPNSGAHASITGQIALSVAAVTWALYTVLSRVATQRYGSLTVTVWANAFGVLFVAVPATLNFNPLRLPTTPWVWAGVLYLGVISTAGAFYLWNKGFEYLPPRIGALYFLVQPIVGSLLGWMLLGERLGIPFLVGTILIVASLFTATLGESSVARI